MSTNITLFGSGLMSQGFVDIMLQRPENTIHIASNLLEEAQRLAQKDQTRCFAYEIDAKNKEDIRKCVQKGDIVVSLLPSFLHDLIAEVCIEENKHLTTSSYVSEAIKAMDAQAREKGLMFIGECGLDPGLDHIMAKVLINGCKKNGQQILEFESWCGGLISPESCDNPIGYKFTWSPIGALRALLNPAIYLKDGQVQQIESDQLLYCNQQMNHVNLALQLEGYPNRDSLKYQKLYGLDDCVTVIRGTLRYPNFAFILRSIMEIGLYKQEPVQDHSLWNELIVHLLNDVQSKQHGQTIDSFIDEMQSDSSIDKECFRKICYKVFNHSYYNECQNIKDYLNKLLESCVFFDLINKEATFKLQKDTSIFENLANHMQGKLKYNKDDKDCIVLSTKIKYKEKDGKTGHQILDMVKIGSQNISGMCQSVSYPLAILTQNILDGKVDIKGVNIPIHEEIYSTMLESLSQNGISFRFKQF